MIKITLTVLALVVGAGVFFRLTTPTESPLEPESVSGWVRHVTDGDSLYIGRYKPQIRLWGVDAPEQGERGYQLAKDTLAKLVQGQHITCRKIDTDRYGRTVGRCFLQDGREVNKMMIESGAAKEYLRFTKGFYGGV